MQTHRSARLELDSVIYSVCLLQQRLEAQALAEHLAVNPRIQDI